MSEKDLTDVMKIELHKRIQSLDFLKLLIQFLHFPDFLNLKPLTKHQVDQLPQLTFKDFVLAYYYRNINDISEWYILAEGRVFKRKDG